MKKNIYIFGAGYVGLANGVLLAKKNKVTMVDIDIDRVKKINERISPIKDLEIQHCLSDDSLDLTATLSIDKEINDADYVIIATPTNFDEKSGKFDTSSIENVLAQLKLFEFKGIIVIRSTIPLGYTEDLFKKGWKRLIFVPEFLREGSALYDSLNPSRIVIGTKDIKDRSGICKNFSKLLLDGASRKETPVIIMKATEAESVKLFSNTYLALRVAFFNELDSYALSRGLDSKKIIEAVGLDPRIGDFYQNPSFGYGGYCLPKDTKQLLASYKDIPQTLISAIVTSNEIRKQFIVKTILSLRPNTVGIFRLIMKKNSDNFRESAIFDIMRQLKAKGVKLVIYEPLLKETLFEQNEVIGNFEEFISLSDIVMVNRIEEKYKIPKHKLFTRDIFQEN